MKELLFKGFLKEIQERAPKSWEYICKKIRKELHDKYQKQVQRNSGETFHCEIIGEIPRKSSGGIMEETGATAPGSILVKKNKYNYGWNPGVSDESSR